MDAKHSMSSSQGEFLDLSSQGKYVFIINSSLLSGRVRTRAWTRQCSDLTTLMYFLRCLLSMKLRPPLALQTRLSVSEKGELITELLGNALLILYRLCLARKCSWRQTITLVSLRRKSLMNSILYDVMERLFEAAMLNFKKEVNYTEDLRNGYTKTTYWLLTWPNWPSWSFLLHLKCQ